MSENTMIENTMSENTTLTTKYEALIKSGMTQEEALKSLVTGASQKTTTSNPRRDQVAYIERLNSIPETRKARKIAYAKISKSKGKPDAIARYQLEIKAADKKLNELIIEVGNAKEPWKKSMELGEDAKGALTYFINSYKDRVDTDLDKKTKGKTRAEVKVALMKNSPSIPNDFPEILKAPAEERVKNGDMMLVTVFRKAAYLKSLTKK